MSIAKTRRYFVIAVILLATVALLAQQAKVNAVEHAAIAVSPNAGSADQPGGRLEIKGIKGSDVVYLNGIGQNFRVGTVEDTRTKNLVLPPGQQHVILVDPQGNKQVYSAYVQIKPGKKTTLHVDKSSIAYENWTGEPGLQIMGVGDARIVPVTGTFTAENVVPCGAKARLAWTTNGVNTMLKRYSQPVFGGVGVSGEMLLYSGQQTTSGSGQQTTSGQGDTKVVQSDLPGSGDLSVDPGEGTTYVLESFGPGGVFISPPQTVHINKEVHTTLTASPAMLRYHRVGDNVLEDGTTTLNWTAENADTVRIDPIGPVTGTSGQQVVKFTPSKNDFGPVEESRTYKITATNPCGGSDTTTASVQIAGSIDPEVEAKLEPLPPLLPKTGSPLPLIALLGFGSVISALVLRMLRKG